MSITDNITFAHFSIGILSTLLIFVALFLMRYFQRGKKKNDVENPIPDIPIQLGQNTIVANNLPS